MSVYCAVGTSTDQLARLRGLVEPAELVVNGDEHAFARCEVVFGNPPAAWIEASTALRWVQLESVGFGEYVGLAATGRVTFTNLAGFFADPVAESALAGLLALGRGIDRLVLDRAERRWEGDELRPRLRLLAGARVVLFGNGAINQRLAELLLPLRCEVTVFSRGWTPAALDAALAKADVVVSTVPDTPGTRGVFDAARLARLPAHAVFANFGRGSVVDESALAAALAGGRLGGAVIDVTVDEPLPATSPLWSTPNTLLTQHSGGGSGDEVDRKIDVFAANLDRWRRGEPLQSVVDFQRGY